MVAPCNQQYPITSSSKYDDEDLPGIGSWSQVRQVRVGAVAKYELEPSPSAGGRRIDYEVTADRQKPEFVRNHAAAASPDFGVFHPALGFFPAPFSLPFFSPGDCGL